MLVYYYVQQIVLRKTRNLEFCFRRTWGPTKQNLRKSISWATQVGLLRSLVSAIRCEANKCNQVRGERPIGSRAVKMLRDLWLRARGLAQHVAAANAHAEKRAATYSQRVNMMSMIVAPNRLRDGSLENATWALGIHLANLNVWRGKFR